MVPICLPIPRPMLLEKPDIVVATPSRLLAHIRAENINLKHSLEVLVVDEADLVFSFGYEADVKELLRLVFIIIIIIFLLESLFDLPLGLLFVVPLEFLRVYFRSSTWTLGSHEL